MSSYSHYADKLTDNIVICCGESSGDGKRYSTESVECCRVAVQTAAGDADVVKVAVSAAESAVISRGVSELREVEGAGGLGAVADGAVARLLAHAHLVGLALEVLRGRGPGHVAIHAPLVVDSCEPHGAPVRRGPDRVTLDLAGEDVPLGRGGGGRQVDLEAGGGGGSSAEVDVHVVP